MSAIFPPPNEPHPESEVSQLERVSSLMIHLCREGDLTFAGRMAESQLRTGGKMLRARLALLSCRALGVPEEQAIPWAAAVELLHNATLVHDDIQDGDTVRRGKPTLWRVHGVPQAINAGDLLLMLPFVALRQLPRSVRGELSLLLAEGASEIVRGQASEMALLAEHRLDKESYLAAARGKTGGLFSLPVAGALCLAGSEERTQEAIRNAFGELGVAFQIQDDVLDLFGDKGRNVVGCDIYEGKVSALVVAQCELAPHSRKQLAELLARPRQEKSERDVLLARESFVESGALDQTLREIGLIERRVTGCPALREVPGLLTVAEEILARIVSPIAHLITARTEAAE